MRESELAFLSIEQAGRLLRSGKISPVDLVESALARIDAAEFTIECISYGCGGSRQACRAASGKRIFGKGAIEDRFTAFRFL